MNTIFAILVFLFVWAVLNDIVTNECKQKKGEQELREWENEQREDR